MISILLIDDDDFQHAILDHILQRCFQAGYTLDGSRSLDAALAVLGEKRFDAIFLDNRLPPYKDFRETFPRIRAMANGAATYLISSEIEDPCFHEAEPMGIAKVVDKFELKNEINGGLLAAFRAA